MKTLVYYLSKNSSYFCDNSNPSKLQKYYRVLEVLVIYLLNNKNLNYVKTK